MKVVAATFFIASVLALVACGSETTVAPLDDPVVTEAVDPAIKARVAEIEKLEDADVLYKIVKDDTMFSDTGKAADKRFTEVLRPLVEKASARDLYDLKQKYKPVPGSSFYNLFDERGRQLSGD